MTKDDLLKIDGMSDEMADAVLAKAENSDSQDSPLQALQKAVDNPEMEIEEISETELSKAKENEEGKENEDKDDYNEKYMKKYMKRYMKENSKACSKMMKEISGSAEKMQKAIDDIDIDSEGAVVEMNDLAPFLESLGSAFENFGIMAKAISDLTETVEAIKSQNTATYSLMNKAATVQINQAKNLDSFLSTSTGRKGIVITDQMKKATDNAIHFSPEDNRVLSGKLMKAVIEGKNQNIGYLASAFESVSHDANKLPLVAKQQLSAFLSGEVQ